MISTKGDGILAVLFGLLLVLGLVWVREGEAAGRAGWAKKWDTKFGAVQTEKDLFGEVETLNWRFEYGKEPAFMNRSADRYWRAMEVISFMIRSDRQGPLYLRMDQKDGRIFLHPFNVEKEWKRILISPEDLKLFPGSGTGRIDPRLVNRIYLVDLNGSDAGFTGSREIWLKEPSLKQEEESAQSRALKIPIIAFGEDGRLLGLSDLEKRGTSGGRWCFLTDDAGGSVPMKLFRERVEVDGQSAAVPVLYTDNEGPVTLEVMFWPVGKTFKLWLSADGRGGGLRGLRDRGMVLLNLELAYSRLAKLKRFLGNSGGARLQGEVARLEAELGAIDEIASSKEIAERADGVLAALLTLSHTAVTERSKRDLENRMAPTLGVALPESVGKGIGGGGSVSIRLIDPEFRIGIGQSFGFADGQTPKEQVVKYYSELRDAGFNHFAMPLFWDQIVDRYGRQTTWDDNFYYENLKASGFTFLAHGLIQTGMPDNVRGLKGEAFTSAALRHMEYVAETYATRYRSSIVMWEAVNEPSSNRWGDLDVDDRIEMISGLVGTLRSTVPGCKVMVNDYDWQRGLDAEPIYKGKIAGTLEFYRKLLRAPNRPDVLGLEWYPGVRVDRPRFGVDMAEPCFDLLDASLYWDKMLALGLPIVLTESNFPGAMAEGDLNGYAWGPWDSESQARAAVDTLRLAMSKPGVLGWTWWSITDAEPWSREGGLYEGPGKPKAVLNALSGFISGLKRGVTAPVMGNTVKMPSLPGIYRISVPGGAGWDLRFDGEGTLSLLDSRVGQ